MEGLVDMVETAIKEQFTDGPEALHGILIPLTVPYIKISSTTIPLVYLPFFK